MFHVRRVPDEIASGPGRAIWSTQDNGERVGEIWFSCGLWVARIATGGPVSADSHAGLNTSLRISLKFRGSCCGRVQRWRAAWDLLLVDCAGG
jgi:hypothetical protein